MIVSGAGETAYAALQHISIAAQKPDQGLNHVNWRGSAADDNE
jgi:hypothetical protein